MIETFELLMKSCEKFELLFVYIQCAPACSLEKVNFKVLTAVSEKLISYFNKFAGYVV